MHLRHYLVVLVCGSVPIVAAAKWRLTNSGLPLGFAPARDSCATIEAPLQVQIEAGASGDLMPPDGTLGGSIRFRASTGTRLPKGLVVDSAWLYAGGRVVAFKVHPWKEDLAKPGSSSGETVAYFFQESSGYFGPNGLEWLWSIERSSGALRFRVMWDRDTSYVKASDCKLRFSM
jgi:hypothetical protein